MTWTTVRRTKRERLADSARLDSVGSDRIRLGASGVRHFIGLLAMYEAGGELIEDGSGPARYSSLQRRNIAREQDVRRMCAELLAAGTDPNPEQIREILWLEERLNT
ncbi:MAG: hypothetical protein OXH38_12450 [Chloroflexi bacterium]|nr:hypothetical protein [Chloroflexota bacterium]